MSRVVGHVDLDYFYAQVEEVENPDIRERPVIVCVFSGRTEDSGVVSTANYKAREFGIHSGMPIVQAKKRLEGKNPAVVSMDHEKYEVVSGRIMDLIEGEVDVFEPAGIDEAFFDLTSSTGGDYAVARRIVESIKESILRSEHLTCSMGVGRSKVVAKLGSDMAKPNGLTVILPEETADVLASLPVTRLYGVGPRTDSALSEIGVRTVGELASVSQSTLEKRFGKKLGAYLLAAATGTDTDFVVAGLEPTQFSRIVTLKRNSRDSQEVFSQLTEGIEYIHGKLKTSGKSFRTVTALGVLTDLSTKTKSKTFETPVGDVVILNESALALFRELSRSIEKDFRRVGVRVSGLTRVEDQTSLSEFVSSVR